MAVWGWNEIDGNNRVWKSTTEDEQTIPIPTAKLSPTWQIVGAICCAVLAGIVAYCSRPESPLFPTTSVSKATVTQR